MTLMAERVPPPDVVDAAVTYLQTKANQPVANGAGEPPVDQRIRSLVLGALALAAIFGIGAAIWIGYLADRDRAVAERDDRRADAAAECRAAFAEALSVAEARRTTAQDPIEAARTDIELALLSGAGLTPDGGAELVDAYAAAAAAAADEAVAYGHATNEREGSTAACAADPSIRPTPPGG